MGGKGKKRARSYIDQRMGVGESRFHSYGKKGGGYRGGKKEGEEVGGTQPTQQLKGKGGKKGFFQLSDLDQGEPPRGK